ncbi:gfo/Idh/MocA family oxidoreductase [Candidatus Bathyarchaeota archaeon]|nr:MAG: gfo/Idh/MocA family oxidoreductase [Candidatus Bathyarchaeota archaeon]
MKKEEENMTKIKVGLVGCGRIMPAHLNGYKMLIEKGIDVRITALVARKKEDALRFRKRGEGPPPRVAVGPPGDPLVAPHVWIYDFQKDVDVEVYTDYREMLRKGDVDAVDIYTPPYLHHTMVLDSIAAGKHVFVEKPLAVSVKAARMMVEAAEKEGKVLGVAEVLRYGPDTRMIKWTIDQGYIGEVQMIVNAIIGCYWSPDKIAAGTPWRHKKVTAGGGPSIDVGVHIFDMARYYCGEIEEVEGVTKVFENIRVTRDESGNIINKVDNEVDDTFVAIAKFDSGALGLFTFSWALHGEPTVVDTVIYGSKGCIKNKTLISDDGTRIPIKELFERNASKEVKERFFPMGITDWFALEHLDFLKAIWENTQMETSGREGLRDLAVSYALIESSRLKRAVKVDDVESGKIGEYEKEINAYYGL